MYRKFNSKFPNSTKKWQLFGKIKISLRFFYQKSSGFLLRPRKCIVFLEIRSEHSHSSRVQCSARIIGFHQNIRVYCTAFSYIEVFLNYESKSDDFLELGLWGDLDSRRGTVRGHPGFWSGVGVPGITGGHVTPRALPETPTTNQESRGARTVALREPKSPKGPTPKNHQIPWFLDP